MPVDTPKDTKNSNVELSDLKSGDTVTVKWVNSSGETGTFTETVTRIRTFEGGTEVSLSQGKIYGDFYLPIVKTPESDEFRLETINKEEL